MADRVFCIDFGSGFTKVALRRDPGADAELLSPRGARADEMAFCIPSLAVVDRTAARMVPEFGAKAAMRSAGNGIEIYRNWKKWLFATPTVPHPNQQPPLDALLHSNDLRTLAAKYGVNAGQLIQLQHLVASARAFGGASGGRAVSQEAQQQNFASILAPHFFHWLREVVLDACAGLRTTGLDYAAIPVRLSVPAFAMDNGEPHPGCKTLIDAMGKAGWRLHPNRPLVAEPYANAIGILTKGQNVLNRSRLHLGQMFSKGPLITSLKDPEHHPGYRALVIDVGAFTTDFAAITLRPDGEAVENPDLAFQVKQRSVPLGISDLDSRVSESLPKDKGEWLRDKAPALDWDDFRRAVYAEGKGFRKAEIGVIGGPADADAIRGSLAGFAGELVQAAESFCGELEQTGLQELILTGGGNFIPSVRESLQQACQSGERTFAKIHAPAAKRVAGGPSMVKLDEQFTRGGTALGGSSLFFESEFY